MSGFQSTLRDAINRAAPAFSQPVVSERGLAQLIDPNMTGDTRFMQKAGYPNALLTPQISALLAENASAGSTQVQIQGNRIETWLRPGVTLSFELGDQVVLESVSEAVDDVVTLTLSEPLAATHLSGTRVYIVAFVCSVTGAEPAGSGSLTGPFVEVETPFILAPGDTLKISGKSFTIQQALQTGTTVNDTLLFDIKTTDEDGFPALETSDDIDVMATPIYRSKILTIPQHQQDSLMKGPAVVDWVSSPIVADYRPDFESRVYIEEFDVANMQTVAPRLVGRNDTLNRIPIERDQFLFWDVVEGSTNWDGVHTHLLGNENGFMHIFSPCRPKLDPAPLSTVVRTVPGFAPYQILLSPGILPGSVSVENDADGSVIPETDYTVDNVAGTISFIAAYVGVAMRVTYRPQTQWQFQVIPSEDDLVFNVKIADEATQTFALGPANVPQTLTVVVTGSDEIDSIHIAGRRDDLSAGRFAIKMTDWQPRGSTTAALQYTLTTGSIRDFDWASSGLILKPMWPTLELLRAKLDSSTPLSHYLDNGRMLV